MTTRVKRWFRKRYLFFRYKFNITHILIPVRETDSGFGLSTLIMFDALRTGIPILVATNCTKNRFAHQMFLMGQLGVATCYTEKYIMDNLLVCPSDDLLGRRISELYVDNSCSLGDISGVCKIQNGFVREG